MSGHQHQLSLLRECDELFRLSGLDGHRFLHEDVFAREERAPGQVVMGDDGGCDDDGVEAGVRQHLVEVGGHAGARIARREAGAVLLGEVREPGEARRGSSKFRARLGPQ